MNMKEARNLRIGDDVVAYNGPYTQRARVKAIERDMFGRSYLWITYVWQDRRGKAREAKKRHGSVYLPPSSAVANAPVL